MSSILFAIKEIRDKLAETERSLDTLSPIDKDAIQQILKSAYKELNSAEKILGYKTPPSSPKKVKVPDAPKRKRNE